jgi:predicted transcriptional regulator
MVRGATRRADKPDLPRPTDAEMAILRILWRDGASTVRHIRAELETARCTAVGHTTALKLVQIMCDKGLIDRDEASRPQVLRPRLPEHETQRLMVRDLLHRVFGGSTRKLMLQLLGVKQASAAEIREVENLLDRIEKDRTRKDRR